MTHPLLPTQAASRRLALIVIPLLLVLSLAASPDTAPGIRAHARPARGPFRHAPGQRSGTAGHPALPFGFSGYGR